MNQTQKLDLFEAASRSKKLATALLLSLIVVLTSIAPALLTSTPAEAAQVTSRKITVSTSKPSATGVTYTISFTAGTTITNPDYIFDFCSNSPLIGDACTATAGTDVPNFSSVVAGNITGVSTPVVTSIGSGRGLKITGTSTYTATSTITITIANVTNPSNTATFYGRLLIYPNGGAGANTSASPGAYTDYGGVALTTVSTINITAKVFETLTFCVYTGSCGGTANITLGDATTGALSTASTYVAPVKYDIATNAGSGVNVTMAGQTLCRAATLSFANCPTGASASTISATGATPVVKAAGSEQFGMCADVTGTSLTVNATYVDAINACHSTYTAGAPSATTSKFGFDDTNGANGTNGTGGSQVISSTGAVSSATGLQFVFMANVAATTEAGLYQSALQMVATGTF